MKSVGFFKEKAIKDCICKEGICNIYLGLKPLYKEDRAKYEERCKEFLDKHEFL